MIYLYVWDTRFGEPAWTDDPKWARRITSGRHQKFLIDGVEPLTPWGDRLKVTRARTGPEGWVIYLVEESPGIFTFDADGRVREIRRGKLEGYVEYVVDETIHERKFYYV